MIPKTKTLVSPLCYDSTEDTQNNLQFVGKKSNRSLVIISLHSEGHRLSLGDKKVEFLSFLATESSEVQLVSRRVSQSLF